MQLAVTWQNCCWDGSFRIPVVERKWAQDEQTAGTCFVKHNGKTWKYLLWVYLYLWRLCVWVCFSRIDLYVGVWEPCCVAFICLPLLVMVFSSIMLTFAGVSFFGFVRVVQIWGQMARMFSPRREESVSAANSRSFPLESYMLYLRLAGLGLLGLGFVLLLRLRIQETSSGVDRCKPLEV